jgi:hypothetical protein
VHVLPKISNLSRISSLPLEEIFFLYPSPFEVRFFQYSPQGGGLRWGWDIFCHCVCMRGNLNWSTGTNRVTKLINSYTSHFQGRTRWSPATCDFIIKDIMLVPNSAEWKFNSDFPSFKPFVYKAFRKIFFYSKGEK